MLFLWVIICPLNITLAHSICTSKVPYNSYMETEGLGLFSDGPRSKLSYDSITFQGAYCSDELQILKCLEVFVL